MSQEPLGLPRGSVRAALTLLLVTVLGLSLFVPLAAGAESLRIGLLVLTALSVRDYFSLRQTQNREEPVAAAQTIVNE